METRTITPAAVAIGDRLVVTPFNPGRTPRRFALKVDGISLQSDSAVIVVGRETLVSDPHVFTGRRLAKCITHRQTINRAELTPRPPIDADVAAALEAVS
jgi:hypothetical protein